MARSKSAPSIGIVHNALMFDKPLKTVVSAPFHPFPRSIRGGEYTFLDQQDL